MNRAEWYLGVVVALAGLGALAFPGCSGAPAPTASAEARAGAAAVQPATSVDQTAESPGFPSREVSFDTFEIRIGAGDLIGIEVFGLPELSREVRVAPDGTISMPLVGSFAVQTLTIDEAARQIERMFVERQLVNEPEVSVSIIDSTSSGVTVQGAVKSPGVYQLTGPTTLLEILVEAGGLAGGKSGAQKIIVLQKTAGGEQVRMEIDAEQLIDRGDLSLNVALRPGDIVLVPEAKSYLVYVSGAVRGPGPVTFLSTDGITVLQAITAAGGPTERANLGKVQVIRRLPDDTEVRFFVNVKKIRKGKIEDFALERNDTVVVGEWFF